MLNFGETLSEGLAKIKHLPKREEWHSGAKKVLGYLQSVSPKYAFKKIYVEFSQT